ncbi:MAG TPA: amino acid permease [Bryobacteraceae bacterium]|nr:amino acid permease [Bryobacteraceae bacterium]
MTGKPASTLLRQLGIVSATALVVSNMIGVGIFSVTGYLADDLGRPGLVVWIWVVGAICALAGALVYSELGINFPSSGGEYVYLNEAFGPTWAFMTGWVSFFAGFSAPIAAAALSFSDYLGHFFPAFRQENAALVLGTGYWQVRVGWPQVVACTLIGVFTILNCVGVRRVARVQNVLTGAKVLVLAAFIGIGFAFGNGSMGHFSQPVARLGTTPLAAQFAISLFFIYVSYSGWNAATYVGEELKNPVRTLPVAMAVGTVLVAALYVSLNVLFIYAMPLAQMKGQIAIGALAATKLFRSDVASLFSGAMALSLMATVNAMITVGPRVYYAMARNGAFFSAAARVDRRWRTPLIAIVLQGVCTMAMTFTPFPALLVYIGFTLNFFAVLSVAALFFFRRRPGWKKLRVVSFAWPLIPAFFILVGSWITLVGVTQQPFIAIAAIVTIATGALVYRSRLASRNPVAQR